jgi:hypothetical protein
MLEYHSLHGQMCLYGRPPLDLMQENLNIKHQNHGEMNQVTTIWHTT